MVVAFVNGGCKVVVMVLLAAVVLSHVGRRRGLVVVMGAVRVEVMVYRSCCGPTTKVSL